MEDASPAKWHLAHTSWFFETLVLEPIVRGYRPFAPGFRVLFNSYYQSVGPQHPRRQRGLLTRPSLEEVLDYRAWVDRHVLDLLSATAPAAELLRTIRLGVEHEQQHQELILTDVKHLLSCNPLHPAARDCPEPPAGEAKPLSLHYQPGGLRFVGHDAPGFAFDNEGPRHQVMLSPFELASRPVTNGEFQVFMADDGYGRSELWLSDGWAALRAQDWEAPLYWEQVDGCWHAQTLGGLRPVSPHEPVCHVSYYEADAFARWMGTRLPTEAEWESAAADLPVEGNFAESGRFHPASTPSAASSDAAGGADGLLQMFGDVWEWTQSDYAAYPGFRPLSDVFGEYNGKFMCNQRVLRGGSCATPQPHIRASYRNFFAPDARWQFSGIRLARDAS
jgi:ergothioneine biosynthesis protein EgtB